MANFKINRQAVKAMFDDLSAKLNGQLEPVASEYQGRPVDEVTPAVEEAFRRAGIEPTDVAGIADAISKGESLPPIVLN
jgi:hypothetical protein